MRRLLAGFGLGGALGVLRGAGRGRRTVPTFPTSRRVSRRGAAYAGQATWVGRAQDAMSPIAGTLAWTSVLAVLTALGVSVVLAQTYVPTTPDPSDVSHGSHGSSLRRVPGIAAADDPATPPRRISTTPDNQIVLELAPDDIVPANLFDLNGRTLLFTPDDHGQYSRSLHPVAWESDVGDSVHDLAEVEFPGFRFPFAGRTWGSFFVSRFGLLTFGEPFASPDGWLRKWGRMSEIAAADLSSSSTPTVSALYKPILGGWSEWDADGFGNRQHVARPPDRVVVTWVTSDPTFHVYGRRPADQTRFQVVLYADGRIAFNYATAPQDPDEAIRDGIVGLFPNSRPVRDELVARVVDPTHRAVAGHLDVVEVAIYTSNTDFLIVEFTTRGPIRPVRRADNVRSHYWLLFDVEEPWWTDRNADPDDEDFNLAVTLEADGSITAHGPGVAGAHEGDEDNRIGLLVSVRELAGLTASVVAGASEYDDESGSWAEGNPWSWPVLADFPFLNADAPTDLSEPNRRHTSRQMEVFHYLQVPLPVHTDGVRWGGIAEVACGIIGALGDEFDFLFFHSEFRHDAQHNGSWWGFYPGTVPIQGIGDLWQDVPPCETGRLRGQWDWPFWIKSPLVANHDPDSGRSGPLDEGLTHFSHELAHTWVAHALYRKNGEVEPLVEGSHWARVLHAPAAFPWRGAAAGNGSIMGGSFWRENGDGTYTPTDGWGTRTGGLSWLDLYLMGLATEGEVPDMFILRNLQEAGGGWAGPYTGDKEIVTIDQIIAALGPRDPPAASSQKVFNAGFVYLVEAGRTPDADLLRTHAEWRDRAVEHWRHITGRRSQLTTMVRNLP